MYYVGPYLLLSENGRELPEQVWVQVGVNEVGQVTEIKKASGEEFLRNEWSVQVVSEPLVMSVYDPAAGDNGKGKYHRLALGLAHSSDRHGLIRFPQRELPFRADLPGQFLDTRNHAAIWNPIQKKSAELVERGMIDYPMLGQAEKKARGEEREAIEAAARNEVIENFRQWKNLASLEEKQEANSQEEPQAESKETSEVDQRWEVWKEERGFHQTVEQLTSTLPERYPLTQWAKDQIAIIMSSEIERVKAEAKTPYQYAAALLVTMTGREQDYALWLGDDETLKNEAMQFRWYLSNAAINQWKILIKERKHPKIADVYDFMIRALCQELALLHEHFLPTNDEEKSIDESESSSIIYRSLPPEQHRAITFIHKQWFPGFNLPNLLVPSAPESVKNVAIGQLPDQNGKVTLFEDNNLGTEEHAVLDELLYWTRWLSETTGWSEERLINGFWNALRLRIRLNGNVSRELLNLQTQALNEILERNFVRFENLSSQLTQIIGTAISMLDFSRGRNYDDFEARLRTLLTLIEKLEQVWVFFNILYQIPNDQRPEALSSISEEEWETICTQENLQFIWNALQNHQRLSESENHFAILLTSIKPIHEHISETIRGFIANNPDKLKQIRSFSDLFKLLIEEPQQPSEQKESSQENNDFGRYICRFFKLIGQCSHNADELVASIINTREFLQTILDRLDENQKTEFFTIPAVRKFLCRFDEWSWIRPIAEAVEASHYLNSREGVLRRTTITEEVRQTIAESYNSHPIGKIFTLEELSLTMRGEDVLKKYAAQKIKVCISSPQYLLAMLRKWKDPRQWKSELFSFDLSLDSEPPQAASEILESCVHILQTNPNELYRFITSNEIIILLPYIMDTSESLGHILPYLPMPTENFRKNFLALPDMHQPLCRILRQTTAENTDLGNILFGMGDSKIINTFLSHSDVADTIPYALQNAAHVKQVLNRLFEKELETRIVPTFIETPVVQSRLKAIIVNMDTFLEILSGLQITEKKAILENPFIKKTILPNIIRSKEDLLKILKLFDEIEAENLRAAEYAKTSFLRLETVWPAVARAMQPPSQGEEKQEQDNPDPDAISLLSKILYYLGNYSHINRFLNTRGMEEVIASVVCREQDLKDILQCLKELQATPEIVEAFLCSDTVRERWPQLIQSKTVFWEIWGALHDKTDKENLQHLKRSFLTQIAEAKEKIQIIKDFSREDWEKLLPYIDDVHHFMERCIFSLPQENIEMFVTLVRTQPLTENTLLNEELLNRHYIREVLKKQSNGEALKALFDKPIFEQFLSIVNQAKKAYQDNLAHPESCLASIGNFFVHNTIGHVNGLPRYAQALNDLSSEHPISLDGIRQILSDIAQHANIREHSFFTYLMKGLLTDNFYKKLLDNVEDLDSSNEPSFDNEAYQCLEDREKFRQWILNNTPKSSDINTFQR